jgi:hypothetical protein
LLVAYGIADPLPDEEIGTFSDPDMLTLFATLVETGSQTLVDALRVGAMVEDLDLADLDAALAVTANPALQRVYTNLVRGSENHLRAFMAQLVRNGATYTPLFISQERFDAIVGSALSTGRRETRRR